jgi:hypothetical protein
MAGGSAGGVAGLRNIAPPAFYGPLRVFATVTNVNPTNSMPNNGAWQPSTGLTFTYQWEQCVGPTPQASTCTSIAGATQPTYRIAPADFGRRLRLRVTANDGTTMVSAPSGATDLVLGPSTAECTLTSTTRSPGQVASEGGVAWTNPTQALTADGMSASVMLPPGRSSQVLRLSGFSFAVPPGAVVTNAQVELRRSASVQSAIVEENIRFANATRVGPSAPLPGSTWPTTPTSVTVFSSTTNLLNLLEDSISSPDFRLELTVRNQSAAPAEAFIDVARVAITYVTATIVDGNPAGVTFTSVSSAPGQVAWTTPDNARLADGMVTESTLTASAASTETLRATNWGLTLPPNISPSSVIVRVRRRNLLGSSVVDRRVALVRGNATLATWPSASFMNWPSMLTPMTFGSLTNRWSSVPTAADVTASDFGVELAADTVAGANPGRPLIDEVMVSVVHSLVPAVTSLTQATQATSFEPRLGWVNPASAAMMDTASATVTFSSGLVSQRLVASGFNFGLPSGAFVSGVVAQVRKNASVINSVRDERALLRLGQLQSESRNAPNSFWLAAFNVDTLGTQTERWGLSNELTAEAVNAPDFSFMLAAMSNAFSSTASVENVQLTVHWCPAP